MTAPAAAPRPGVQAQLPALLRLRWQMTRRTGTRVGLVTAVLVLSWLLYTALTIAGELDPTVRQTALEVAPSAFLGFALLAVVAPLTAGGGSEIVPPDQLVAFPVRPATQFLGGVALAPVNLVWVVQLIVLSVMTSCLTFDGSLPRGALTTATYVGCITVVGQALAWLVVGVRQTRRGRRGVGLASAALAVAVVVVIRTGHGDDVLAASPTRAIVRAIPVRSGQGELRWAVTTGLLAVVLVAMVLAGTRICAWALARPGDLGATRRTGPVRRRAPRRSALRELVAVDRASVWRAPALRRGGLVLTVLPGMVAAFAQVPYESLIVLPGLVAAGAGLLFGINAFCLDGSGAVWLASLPHDPRTAARAKMLVLTETVVGAVVLSAVLGSLRSPGTPTVTELVGITSAGLTCTAIVVAQCMRASVLRPHRADLAGPRDAVAPPGALAIASARLAAPAALIGVFVGAATTTGVWWLPIAFSLLPFTLAVLSLRRTLRRYDRPVVRARVVQVVSAG